MECSNVWSWSNWVLETLAAQHSLNPTLLSSRAVSRIELVTLSENASVDVIKLDLRILSRGGMHRRHAVSALATWPEWQHIIAQLCRGSSSHSATWHSSANIRSNKLLKRVGSVYFKKLIYFCNPKHDGYIMDQWTAL